MIGLDSNVIIRHLAQDDRVQSALASRLIVDHLSASSLGFLSLVVLAETAWVLERSYAFAGRELADALETLVQTESLVIEKEQQVYAAIVALRRGRASFGDALIWGLAREAGCETTLTFDRKAARYPGFKLFES